MAHSPFRVVVWSTGGMDANKQFRPGVPLEPEAQAVKDHLECLWPRVFGFTQGDHEPHSAIR